MSSDDSDDEPLSVLATIKKATGFSFPEPESSSIEPPKKKKRKKHSLDKVPKEIGDHVRNLSVLARPADVWLYLKDLNPTGPYSCLLCTQFFTNRFKIVIHYILDHKKDYCGICRYFVTDRETWLAHGKEHTPWPCSQCTDSFAEEYEMRSHLSKAHKLVHCRLCHFQVTDGDEYYDHLFQKHNVNDAACIEEEILWEVVHDGVQKFHCFLCTKSNILGSLFYNHFMAWHHVNLKCLTAMLSGKNLSLQVPGIHLSQQFIVNELKSAKFGYGEVATQALESQILEPIEDPDLNNSGVDVLELKHEIGSEDESGSNSESADKKVEYSDIHKDYKGDEDFDLTSVELIIMETCYFEYAEKTVHDINSNQMPNVNIDFEKVKLRNVLSFECTLCNSTYDRSAAFALHFARMHGVKTVPIFSCRMCATVFETRAELDSHLEEEKKDFEELWLCQFCDEEFSNRQTTRTHLLEHRDVLEIDNCFSPHLGFKCKYCPTLFWNEPDREMHQLTLHSEQLKNHHYKCQHCLEIFSEKMWFMYHYLTNHKSENGRPAYLFKCTICCLIQPTLSDMRNHFNEHHPESKKFYCSLESCNYRPLATKKSFGVHVKTVHSATNKLERKVKCTVCNKDFQNARACGVHMGVAHGPGRFKCKVCNEFMQTRDERKLHYMIRHPGHLPYQCNECDKSFMYKSTLYMHKQQHGDLKSFTCTYCAKVFNKKDSFREHLQIHEGPRHACSYCPMKFVQRSNMLRHERRHTGERPYACQYCPRTFADKGACNSHTRTHLNLAPFTCMYCGQTFAQKSKLTYHIRKHTGENLETCTICSKLFTSACSLREHMKTHASKRTNVKCPVCGNGYRDERYMIRHLRTAHSRFTFPCPLCKKTFRTHTSMKQHVLTHSKVNPFKCKYCTKSYSIQRSVMKHLKKRHGMKGPFTGLRDYFEKVDPRECGLGLDEKQITSIFGPRKVRKNDVIIADFVAITNSLLDEKARLAALNPADNEGNTSDEDDENDDEDQSDDYNEGEPSGVMKELEHVIIKTEPKSDDDESFEPSDFVTVKIEPMDETPCD